MNTLNDYIRSMPHDFVEKELRLLKSKPDQYPTGMKDFLAHLKKYGNTEGLEKALLFLTQGNSDHPCNITHSVLSTLHLLNEYEHSHRRSNDGWLEASLGAISEDTAIEELEKFYRNETKYAERCSSIVAIRDHGNILPFHRFQIELQSIWRGRTLTYSAFMLELLMVVEERGCLDQSIF